MLSPLHLNTLLEVVRCKSFADAARRLGYTASAVSQQMAALERQLGLTLFEREPHGIRTTAAAQFIASRVPRTLGAIRDLEEEVDELIRGTRGRLRLGSFPTASERLLPYALSTYLEGHPDVQVELDEGEPGELLAMVESREIDLALVYHYELGDRRRRPPPGAKHLLTEHLFVLVGDDHGLATSGSTTVQRLADETWVATREDSDAATVLRRLARDAGFEPQVRFRSNDYDVVRELVKAGLGIALVPALGHLAADGVTAIRLDHPRAARHVSVVRSRTALDATTSAFVEALVRIARRMSSDQPGLVTSRPAATTPPSRECPW